MRYSGTEMLARVMIEGEDPAEIGALAREIGAAIGRTPVRERLRMPGSASISTTSPPCAQARRVDYPDPIEAALAAERAGAGAITVHLREDRRHIQDRDLLRLRQEIHVRLNQELAPDRRDGRVALESAPHEVCRCPNGARRITTEGGLDVAGLSARLAPIIAQLKRRASGCQLLYRSGAASD